MSQTVDGKTTIPEYKRGDQAIIKDSGRACYIRTVYEDKHRPYYEIVSYLEDLDKERGEHTPRNLQWEFELKPGRKTKVLPNGKVIFAEPKSK